MSAKIETDYDTGWREGYEAASGAAIDLRAENERLRAEVVRLDDLADDRLMEVERLRAALRGLMAAEHPPHRGPLQYDSLREDAWDAARAALAGHAV